MGLQNGYAITYMDRLKTNQSIAPRLLKTKEAARYLGRSEWSFRPMVQNGELPMVGRWMFDIKDLDEWIMRNKRRL